jgi:hypothetical protein
MGFFIRCMYITFLKVNFVITLVQFLKNPTTVENVEWLQNNTNLRVTSDVMLTWSKEDVPKSNMKEEYNFCDKDILHNVIEGKVS